MADRACQNSRDNVPLAVGAIVLAVFGLSLGDGVVKLGASTFVLWQIFVLRALLALPVLIVVMAASAPELLRAPPGFRWAVLRSVLLVVMWIAYYVSLPHLDLSVAAAAFYTAPLVMSLLSGAFLGDRVGPAGWAALAVGFLGVLLILRPDVGTFNAYVLLPLVAATLYAAAMVITRTKCRSAHPLQLALVANATFPVIGGLVAIAIAFFDLRSGPDFLTAPWSPMGRAAWLSMSVLAVAIIIGTLGAAIAYQRAPPAIVGTFDYAYVAFAFLWGLILLNEVPSALSTLGMGLIIAAGIVAVRR